MRGTYGRVHQQESRRVRKGGRRTSRAAATGAGSAVCCFALVVRPRRPAEVADDNRVREMALAGARAGKSGRA
jgi:hypothetical protein